MIAVHAYPSEPGRRCFLKSVGALSVGFVAGCAIPVIPKRPAPTLKDANGWIGFDGSRYRLVVPRVEKGQNIATALASIACTAKKVARLVPPRISATIEKRFFWVGLMIYLVFVSANIY